MAVSGYEASPSERSETGVQIRSFEISGLFGYLSHKIEFPTTPEDASKPSILIVEGQNGTGKTTIMKMIAGIVDDLNFDPFRRVPFDSARLTLTNGDELGVYSSPHPDFPLTATFRQHKVPLARERGKHEYTREKFAAIEAYRNDAMPVLSGIVMDLITIDRSLEADGKPDAVYVDSTGAVKRRREPQTLAIRVRNFLRDAQVNYRRFFQTSELELLPRILKQLQEGPTADPQTLLDRVSAIQARNKDIARFGLQVDERELATLSDLLGDNKYSSDMNALSLLSSYVEIHESRSKARELLALRLSLFESIMDDFFVGKQIRISQRNGFDVTTRDGMLTEKDLSSGEFHFLYMMVAALLCERAGTIIAIDEPELSLHVSWQRRLIGALSKCASGAAPLFFLSTHSTAISTAHSYAVKTFSAID